MFISSLIKTFTGNWVVFGIRISTLLQKLFLIKEYLDELKRKWISSSIKNQINRADNTLLRTDLRLFGNKEVKKPYRVQRHIAWQARWIRVAHHPVTAGFCILTIFGVYLFAYAYNCRNSPLEVFVFELESKCDNYTLTLQLQINLRWNSHINRNNRK